MTQPDQGLKARLDALRAKATDDPLHDDGRYFDGDWHSDLTQCGHGDTGEFGCCDDGKLIAALWNALRANQLITLSDHEAAVKSAVDARDDEILEVIDAKFSGALELRDLARKTKDAQGAIIHGEAVQTLADMRAAIRARRQWG